MTTVTPTHPTIAAPPIVTARWLAERLGTVTVIDTRRSDEFLDGHVPGAVSFPLGGLIMEDTTRAALERLGRSAQQALAARGIGRDAQVVLIDDNDGSASVGVFVCELAGLAQVSAVHGGIRAWMHEGQPTEVTPASRDAVVFDGGVSLATVASIEDVQTATGRNVRLVDTRSQLEHEGIVGSPCCPYRGNIPGSVHLEWTSLLSATGDLHGPDRIRNEAHHVGLNEYDEIIVYCHSGQRSAIAGLALRAAGFTNVRNSLGSWHEWSLRGLSSGTDD